VKLNESCVQRERMHATELRFNIFGNW